MFARATAGGSPPSSTRGGSRSTGGSRARTARRATSASRSGSERDLRGQAAQLAATEERAHLARELHDSVTQALFSMTLLTRSIELMLPRDPEQAEAKLATLRELQRDALAEMRSLIFELRPGSLAEDGLVRALRTHTAALQGRVGLPITVAADGVERLPIEIEDALYRIAQEALHNVVKHALRVERRGAARPTTAGGRAWWSRTTARGSIRRR